MGDEDLVGAFGLLGDLLLFVAALLVVVGGTRDSVVAAAGWRPGGEFELAPLVADQTGPGERIVLVLGDQMPGEDCEFAGGGDDRDLETAAGLDPLVERPQRSGRAAGGPGRLHQHAAHLGPTRLADPAVDRGGVAGLADLRVPADVGDYP